MNELANNSRDPVLRNLFYSLGQAGRHVFLISSVGFVNIHISTSKKGFWGVDESVKEDFDALAKIDRLRCLYVFLVSRNDRFVARGYIASDLASPPFVRPVRLTENGFRINQEVDLDSSKALLSIDEVARDLIKRYAVKSEK
jgi:hypothetical protein